MIVIVVESDFAPGNHFRTLRKLLKLREIPIPRQLGLVRMNPDGRVDEVIFLRQLYPAIKRSRSRSAPDCNDRPNAGFPRPRNHLLAVRVKLLHLKMSMGIYKHVSSLRNSYIER